MNFEYKVPVAEKLPEWKQWQREGITGDKGILYTPDGRKYPIRPNEVLRFLPEEPTENEAPQPFIEDTETGAKLPFEEWAANQEIGEPTK